MRRLTLSGGRLASGQEMIYQPLVARRLAVRTMLFCFAWNKLYNNPILISTKIVNYFNPINIGRNLHKRFQLQNSGERVEFWCSAVRCGMSNAKNQITIWFPVRRKANKPSTAVTRGNELSGHRHSNSQQWGLEFSFVRHWTVRGQPIMLRLAVENTLTVIKNRVS